MSRSRIATTVPLALAIGGLIGCGGAEAPPPPVAAVDEAATPAERTLAVLERAGAAYRALPGFVETFVMTIRLPGAEPGERVVRSGAWGDQGAFLELGPYRFVLEEERLVVTDEGSSRHVVAPAAGGLEAALEEIGAAAAGIRAPATLVLREGRPAANAVDALRFEVFDELTPAGVTERPDEGLLELRFEAPTGRVLLRLDAASGLFHDIALEASLVADQPPLEMAGAFDLRRLAAGERAVPAPDLAGGVAVASFEALELGEPPLGDAVPDLELRTLSGGVLRLSELRGRIVVLDLWATWCIPCRRTLLQTDALARWVAESGHPVTVLGVATMETGRGFDGRRDPVADFWRREDYRFDTVIDPADRASPALGDPGIPSAAVIAPDGTLVAVHAGASRELGDQLRREVEALLR